MENKNKTKDLTMTAMVAAMVFVLTYTFKIPSPAGEGYTHLGDCMIFVGVMLLGTRNGALAGGIGAALSDLIGGYAHWVIPTFFIKMIMAFITGLFSHKIFKGKIFGFSIGSVLGGIVQVILYALVTIPMEGFAAAIENTFGNSVQSAMGVVISSAVVIILNTSGVLKKLQA